MNNPHVCCSHSSKNNPSQYPEEEALRRSSSPPLHCDYCDDCESHAEYIVIHRHQSAAPQQDNFIPNYDNNMSNHDDCFYDRDYCPYEEEDCNVYQGGGGHNKQYDVHHGHGHGHGNGYGPYSPPYRRQYSREFNEYGQSYEPIRCRPNIDPNGRYRQECNRDGGGPWREKPPHHSSNYNDNHNGRVGFTNCRHSREQTTSAAPPQMNSGQSGYCWPTANKQSSQYIQEKYEGGPFQKEGHPARGSHNDDHQGNRMNPSMWQTKATICQKHLKKYLECMEQRCTEKKVIRTRDGGEFDSRLPPPVEFDRKINNKRWPNNKQM